ncbi:hypothetical protein ACFL2R_03640 [Patescibacteria group bacterium]
MLLLKDGTTSDRRTRWKLVNTGGSTVRVRIIEPNLYSGELTRAIVVLKDGDVTYLPMRYFSKYGFGVYIQNMSGVNIGWIDTYKN